MASTHFRHWLLAIFALVSVGSVAVHTQAQIAVEQERQITLAAGTILEVVAQTAFEGANYSWVLTHDRTFIQAGRNRVFRVRLTQTGRYQLTAEASTPDGKEQERRIIPIDVRDRVPEDAVQTNNEAPLLTTDPPVDPQGIIGLSAERQVILITPVRSGIESMDLDLDLDDDNDAEGTFFSTQGTPLFIWFAGDQRKVPAIAKAALTDGTSVSQSLTVGPSGSVGGGGGTVAGDILSEEAGDGMIVFSLSPRLLQTIEGPVLLQWDFGDGEQSLLDRPVHTYAETGTKHVTVTIRSLESGTVTKTVETTVEVTSAPPPVVTEPEVTPDEPEKEPSTGGSALGLIFKILFVLIGFGLLGFGSMFLVSKLRRKGGLEKMVAKVEEKLTTKDVTPAEVIGAAAPPMQLPETELPVQEAETVATEPVAPPPAQEEAPAPVTHTPLGEDRTEPAIEPEAAPPWLRKGIEVAEQVGQTPLSPVPSAPLVPPEALPPTVAEPEPVAPIAPEPPAPAPEPEPPVEEATTDMTIPPWLQTAPTPAPQPTPSGEPAAPAEALSPPAVPTPAASEEDVLREEREREKRRKKRQRYRENLKKRKDDGQTPPATTEESPEGAEETNDDEPIAIIRAESLEDDQNPPQEQPLQEPGKNA